MASSSSSSPPMKHQVFFSFRGEDTRLNFTSHLLKALKDTGLNVFFDEEKLERGEPISPALSQAIAASRLSIIVLSSDYASSKSCLAELSDIMDRRSTHGQIVLPIFYHVDPSSVRNFGGSFETSFQDHGSNKPHDEVKRWEAAFAEVGKLKGWHIEGGKFDRSESDYIKDIVEYVIKKLMNSSSKSASEELIGIDDQKKTILDLVKQQDIRVIGLWGMGGIGKTTLADAVYKEASTEFEDHYFLQNVSEKIEKQGTESLRNELLSKLLNQKGIHIDTPSIGNPYKERLNNKKLFVVLDDVTDSDQIDFMGVRHFGIGSKIILTSRDRQVLKNGGANQILEVNKLNKNDSFQLFSAFAFKLLNPPVDFRDLSSKFVDYAQGCPLALKVLGSKLYTKSRKEWESEVDRLKQYVQPKISQILKSSFDGLDELEKNIFLDIACFFKGEFKEDVERILSCLYNGAVSGISNLLDKCLLDITSINLEVYHISMHDMLEEMGKDIVRQESKDPGKRSRLWIPKDAHQVFKYNKGTESIEGIKLRMSQIDNLRLHPLVFENMINLRYICFYDFHWNKKLHVDGVDIAPLPDELRYLQWDYYPFKSLSSSFNPKNLVVLELRHSNIEQLWNENEHQDLGNLREIDVSYSRKLRKIPNLLGAINLKSLRCWRCESLVELPCLDHLTSLEALELCGCKRLRKIPNLLGVINLKYLSCRGCDSLVELPSLNHLTSLKMLELDQSCNLKKFPELPNNFSKLDLSCTGIEEVPDSIEHLVQLRKLGLRRSKVQNVSSNILKLEFLNHLDFGCCKRLKSLSELPPCLLRLDADDCTSLEEVSFTNHNLFRSDSFCDGDDDAHKEIIFLSFSNCFSMNQDSVHNIEANAMFQIQFLAQRWACRERRRNSHLQKKYFCCFPGNEISENDFEYRSVNSSLNLKIAPNGCSGRRFLAFAICLVANLTRVNLVQFICKYELIAAGGETVRDECRLDFEMRMRASGDHVAILFSEDMIKMDSDYEEASFEFNIEIGFGSEEIKVEKCGVHVFYVEAESCTISDVMRCDQSNRNFDSQEDANIEEVHGGFATERRFSYIGGEEGEGGSKRLKCFHFI